MNSYWQIWQVVKHSLSWTWENKGLITYVFAPFLVMLLIYSVLTTFNILFSLLGGFILTWFFSTGMVQIHKEIILNGKQQFKLFPKLEKVYFKYFGLWLLLSFIIRVFFKLFFAFSERLATNFDTGPFLLFIGPFLLGVIGSFVFLYLIVRLYFVFPSISVGNSLVKTFDISHGEFKKTYYVLLLFFIPFFTFLIIVVKAFFFVLGPLPSDIFYKVVLPLYVFLYFFSSMFVNILYSVMLKELQWKFSISNN